MIYCKTCPQNFVNSLYLFDIRVVKLFGKFERFSTSENDVIEVFSVHKAVI